MDSHQPRIIASPDGAGLPSHIGCSCGSHPTKGATSSRTQATWFKSHLRKIGGVAPQIIDVMNTRYGSGCAAEGMTYLEWKAANPGRNAITGVKAD